VIEHRWSPFVFLAVQEEDCATAAWISIRVARTASIGRRNLIRSLRIPRSFASAHELKHAVERARKAGLVMG
jgi:hypothetical protein